MEAGKGTSRTTAVQSLLAGAGEAQEGPGGAATTGLRAAQGTASAEC